MKFNIKKIKRAMPAAVVVAACLALGSCKKQFQLEPETELNTTQVYRNVYDADAAVIGVYGKLLGIARQYVILNELRGDLMQVTQNADAALRDISTHKVKPGNPYADPRPFYALINDCNDVLKNFGKMRVENKMKQEEYDMRYSDIGAIRSWLYLQLAIHFGKVPFVTDPLETVDAVKDASRFPRLEFEQMIDTLIAFTEALPWKAPYLPGTNLMITVDGTPTQRFFIEKNGLLGDLHLWKASINPAATHHYPIAATYYRKVMESEGYFVAPGGEQFYDQFKNSSFGDFSVTYAKGGDIYSLTDNNTAGWRSMFGRSLDNSWRQEWVWALPFHASFKPENPFIDLFSNNGGRYLVKPSQEAIDKWNGETQRSGLPYDARGQMTYKTLGGQPVITKYLYNYLDETSLLPVNLLQKGGTWFLSRASGLHLKFAEAANRDGRPRLAVSFISGGLGSNFDTSTASGRDVTNLQHTLWESEPAYRFDARLGEVPRFRAPWYRHTSIRRRSNLPDLSIPAGDSLNTIERSLLHESALELAYEGNRWPDLVRYAHRNGASVLADAVYRKLQKDGFAGAAEVRTYLEDKNHWYLPFNW
ncbi:RagB/SusD family nutrient uptake outer membrane protein [Paraflavisolibacter sp. H34]|uniref:RagB/SusD family nutrient uptake outer membrane protein n=1 Tax=Huijunlia imazamoxiresistens TaxID=3127457 RepID=UPI003017CD75